MADSEVHDSAPLPHRHTIFKCCGDMPPPHSGYPTCTGVQSPQGDPGGWATRKLLCGGGWGWHGRPAKEEGGGVPEMGFRAGPFVLWKDGCCHQRRRNTNFGPEKFFSQKNFPPQMCSQNDQRDVGIILSHVCWGPPPPPGHGR